MIRLDPAAATAPTEQIRSQLAERIRYGTLPAGSRLPSIRQLAADLRVAPGTVAKAYATLEREGLVVSSRARGTRVVPGRGHDDRIRDAARSYVAAVAGLDLDQALGAVRAAWAEGTQPGT